MARKVWAFGRLMVGVAVVLMIGVVAVSLVLKLAHGQDAGSTAVDVSTQLAEIRRLRDDAKDYPAAAALAEQVLATVPDACQARQQVEFEYGVVALRQKNLDKARSLFDDMVTTYAAANFATAPGALADPNVVVDDAEYYLAAMVQDTQDVAGTKATYEKLFSQFQGSNRTAQALLRLAGFLQAHGDLAGGSARFAEAAAAFERVLNDSPTGPGAPAALQSLNRALIHSDLTAWSAGQVPTAALPGHFATVESNVARAQAQYAGAAEAPGILLDAINYCDSLAWWQGGLGLTMRQHIVEWAERLVAQYPDTTEGWLARGSLAIAVSYSDPQRALALLDTVVAHATDAHNAGDRAGAVFLKAVVMQNTGDLAGAQALWNEALRGPLPPVMEAEANAWLAQATARLGDVTTALQLLDAVVANEAYPRGARGTALLTKASVLRQAHRRAEARETLRLVAAQYAEEAAGATAQSLLAN